MSTSKLVSSTFTFGAFVWIVMARFCDLSNFKPPVPTQ